MDFWIRPLKKAKSIVSKNIKVIGYPNNSGKVCCSLRNVSRQRRGIIGFVDSGELDYGMIPMMLEHFKWYKARMLLSPQNHPVSQVYYPWQKKNFIIWLSDGSKIHYLD